MKLNPRKVHPENGSICFVITKINGLVGVALFENGKWYQMPEKREISEFAEFTWIELNYNPELNNQQN